ncbi:MAG: hypothetical protein K8S87_12180, partial [Planctomycetes bacterium]|nr:hypothetical protein [Planctomycetota bacterium]
GFARIATVLNDLCNERIPTLTVSGGNDYGREFYDEFNGVAAAILLDEMGYNIITPDVNEFKDGEITYDASIKDTKYDILSGSTNFETRSLKRRIKPYVIKEINGHKIGFLCSLGIKDFNRSKFFLDARPKNEFSNKKTETEIILAERIRQMRADGTVIIVFVVDSEDIKDMRLIFEDNLAVDIAIIPQTMKPEVNDSKFRIDFSKLKTKVYFYPTYETENLPVLQIDIEFVKGEDGKTVLKQSHEMIKITKDTPKDPKIKEMVDEFASQLP